MCRRYQSRSPSSANHFWLRRCSAEGGAQRPRVASGGGSGVAPPQSIRASELLLRRVRGGAGRAEEAGGGGCGGDVTPVGGTPSWES